MILRAAILLVALAGAAWLAWAGLRLPEGHLPIRPLAGTGEVRLVTLGTSLTARSAWPERLADAMAECSGRPVQLLRLAEPGATSDWGLAQLDKVAAFRPDLVLVEFAVNDADLTDGLWPWRSRSNHRAILAGIGAGAPQGSVALVTTNPARGLRGLARPLRGLYDDGYRRMARGEGAGLIDLAPVWRRALGDGDAASLLPDGLHPAEDAVMSVALPEILAQVAQALGCAVPVPDPG